MKRLTYALVALMLSTASYAQEGQQENAKPSDKAHYIVLDFGGGFHNLSYSLDDNGKRTPGMGIMGRVGYRYLFTKHWGVGANLTLKTSKTEAKLDFYNQSDLLTDNDGDQYYSIIRYNGLKERQEQTSIGIPVGLYFQGQIVDRWKIGIGIGVSANFVNKESMKTVSGNLSTEAYYPKDDITFKDMDNHGFYTKSDFEGSYDYKATFGTYFELNLLYALSKCIDVHVGFYGNYGLSKATKSNDNLVYAPVNETYNGVLNSSVTDGSRPMSVGMMAGFRFKIGKNPADDKKIEDDGIKSAVVVDNQKPQDDIKDADKDANKQQPEDNNKQQQPEDNKQDDSKAFVDNNTNKPAEDDKPQPSDGQVINITDIIGINTGNKPKEDDSKTKPADNNQNQVYTEKGKKVVINGRTYEVVDTIRMIINFDLGSTGDPDIKVVDQTIDDVAEYLKQHHDYKLSIVGHTCDLGSYATNKRVGLARANTVKQEFIKRGIKATQLLTSTKADTQPLVPNSSEENRKKNRRVELEYVK